MPDGEDAVRRRLLRRCLARDPRDRLHHLADARIELGDTDQTPLAAGSSPRGLRIAVAVLAIALIASLSVTLPSFWRPTAERAGTRGGNPLAGARFSKFTDFPGSEFDAAISPDGRFVAFVSEGDGPFEVLVGQVGTDVFRKLASGADEFALEDTHATVRGVGFNGDGSEIWLGGGQWRRVRSMPLLGGPLRNFLEEYVVDVAWSPDGKQVVYHERFAGDPLYVADRNGANIRKILGSPAGTHQHYPIWSVDGGWIYLVRGRPATLEMDLWRVRPDGEELEQLTQRKLDVRYPTPIDERTVRYSARDTDGAGPWLWALDVETKVSRRAVDCHRGLRRGRPGSVQDPCERRHTGADRRGRSAESGVVAGREPDRLCRCAGRSDLAVVGRPAQRRSGRAAGDQGVALRRTHALPAGWLGAGLYAGLAALSGFLSAGSHHDEEPPADRVESGRHNAHLRHHARRQADRVRPIERRLRCCVNRAGARKVICYSSYLAANVECMVGLHVGDTAYAWAALMPMKCI